MTDLDAPTLGQWASTHQPDEALYWRGGVADQTRLFLELSRLLTPYFDSKQWREANDWRRSHDVRVVSTHRSKSVTLPVVKITGDHVALIIRGNFFNYVVSVETDREINDTFFDLISRDEPVHTVYAEGFDPSWVHGPYCANRQVFTTYVPYVSGALWAFIWLLSKQVVDAIA